jgi:catechol 2,3-dioxygenase-like lactoylglutathione lyase family enzyme
MGDAPASFETVLETSLYHDSTERAEIEGFYSQTLGLRQVSSWPDGLAFRVGAAVLLLFDRQGVARRDGPIAAHGSSGPGHACLVATPAAYEGWKRQLAERGVEITHEHEWDSGRRSFYFQDPAGNLLEIADGDLWPG